MITAVLLGLIAVPFLIVAGVVSVFWKRKARAVSRWGALAYLGTVLVVMLGVGPYAAAWALIHAGTRGPDRNLRQTPAEAGIAYENIVFDATDGLRLSGWFVPPARKNAVIILTHGLFRNRREMLSRAVALARAGYGTLLYDSRSHGESAKGVVSLGRFEKNDVLGAIGYVAQRYQDAPEAPRIVLMGISMGAVATLAAAAETRNYAALVVDSPFASLRQTVIDHAWLFLKMPRYPFPSLFLFWFQRLGGFEVDRVNTYAALERVQPVPILFIGSEGDRRIRPEVVRALHGAASAPVKQIVLFPGEVGHGAAARLRPEWYASVLVRFLDSALAGAPVATPAEPPVSKPSAATSSPR